MSLPASRPTCPNCQVAQYSSFQLAEFIQSTTLQWSQGAGPRLGVTSHRNNASSMCCFGHGTGTQRRQGSLALGIWIFFSCDRRSVQFLCLPRCMEFCTCMGLELCQFAQTQAHHTNTDYACTCTLHITCTNTRTSHKHRLHMHMHMHKHRLHMHMHITQTQTAHAHAQAHHTTTDCTNTSTSHKHRLHMHMHKHKHITQTQLGSCLL